MYEKCWLPNTKQRQYLIEWMGNWVCVHVAKTKTHWSWHMYDSAKQSTKHIWHVGCFEPVLLMYIRSLSLFICIFDWLLSLKLHAVQEILGLLQLNAACIQKRQIACSPLSIYHFISTWYITKCIQAQFSAAISKTLIKAQRGDSRGSGTRSSVITIVRSSTCTYWSCIDLCMRNSSSVRFSIFPLYFHLIFWGAASGWSKPDHHRQRGRQRQEEAGLSH